MPETNELESSEVATSEVEVIADTIKECCGRHVSAYVHCCERETAMRERCCASLVRVLWAFVVVLVLIFVRLAVSTRF